MSLEADHNLLFGMVAIQLDFIRRDQLIESLNAWATSKDCTLAELLEASGALTKECRKLLESIVDEQVRKHGGDAQVSMATMPFPKSIQADLSRIEDDRIAKSLIAVTKLQAAADPFATSPFQTASPSAHRFKVLRALAQGGLGTVSVARDGELNREVALKEIQQLYADDQSARSRFVLEAEVTGGLEHPNIVPVYGFGHYADGRPYYAMRLIKGESLKEVVDRFHSSNSKKPNDPSSPMVELRNLLRRFIDVCQAIDYAHSRGVIHRDLKPGNIMLGDYGETLVVDWGLAKTSKTAEESSSNIRLSAEPVLIPNSNQAVEPTQMGSTIGTIQFMSPEQAAGRNDLVGPASDIYSLGATLYYVLTGKASILGSNVAELLRAIQTGNFPLPSVAGNNVPKALEAICLKAMSLEPSDRYPSARALAHDLDCWMADEPVSSLRETTSERVGRWLRRHRTWFRAVSTAAFVVILVLATALLLINQQRNVANQQRTLAEGLAKEKTDLATREMELRQKAEWQSASRSIEQSVALAQHVDAATGVLSLVRDLEEVQRIQAADLERNVRSQLGRWEGALHTLQSIVSYSDAVRTLAQSPDGKAMLVGTNGLAHLVDLASQKEIGKPLAHTDIVLDAVFNRASDLLITGSQDKSIRFWNSRTGEAIGAPLLQDESVSAIALSFDERILATACGAKIQLWDMESRQRTEIEFDQMAMINDLAFSPTEPILLAGDWTGRVKLWNIETKERVGTDWNLGYPLMSMTVSPDGKLVATCDIGNEVKLWSIKTGEPVGTPLMHFGMVTRAEFSADGKQLLTASADQMVRLWDVASRTMIGPPLRHPSVVTTATFDRNKQTVWTGCSDKGLRQWQLANGKSVPLALGKNGNVIQADFNKEGTAVRMIVSAIKAGESVFPGELRRWNVPTGTLLGKPTPNLQWRNIATFTHSGDYFASLTNEDSVQIFRVADGEPSGSPISVQGEISALAFNHGDSVLLVGTKQGQVQLWRVASGEPLREPIQLKERISSAAFFPDDNRFIIGSWDNTARVYSVVDEAERNSISLNHESLVTFVGVHPEGGQFFTCLGDGSLRLWDSKTSEQIGSVMKIMPRPNIVMFSPDGNSLLTSCMDGSTRQWDVRAHTEIGPVLRQSKQITSLAQSRNGRWIATASGDWTARLWDIGPEIGEYRQVKSKFETLTGSLLENDGKIKPLSIDEWKSLGDKTPR